MMMGPALYSRLLLLSFVIPNCSGFGVSSRLSSRKTTPNSEGNGSGRKGWDVGRFAKTAAFFGAFVPPNPIRFLSRAFGRRNSAGIVDAATALYTPKTPNGLEWGPLDDVVMGGRSKSSYDPSTGRWNGVIITEGGGFAGLRTKIMDPPLDLSACKGIVLKVRGNGQRIKFILRDDEQWNGIAWSSSFDTVDRGVSEVKLPFDGFTPTKFAQIVRLSTPLNKATITALQLTYSKFEYEGDLNPKFKAGEFSLIIDSISTF